MAMPSSQITMNYAQFCDIVREIWMRSESEMVPELRPDVMPVDIFKAAIKGDSKVLIPRLGLQREEQGEILVPIEDSHSAPDEINTEIQTAQSVLYSATRFGDTILHLLITEGHNELALKVFQCDHSMLNARNNMFETPLYCAAKVGNTDVINKLIDSKRAVVKDALAETNKTGDTALLVAAKLGHIDIGCALMNLDSEVAYKVNDEKKTPLYMAIIEGFTKMVESMLEVDPTPASTPFLDGMFPVHEAAHMGNLKLVKHFMEKYPEDAELRDPYGRNFFHVAAENNGQEFFNNATMEKKFEEIGGEDDSKLHQWREMKKRMITAKNYEGNTPFHIAAMKGNREIMRAIWEHFKDAQKVRNKKGYTPLQLSAKEVEKNNEDINNVMIAEYLETHRYYKFTPKWFDDFMDPPLKSKWERVQVIRLGSVLITTVTFAAAFTISGGYNQDHSTPILGRRYMFRAFIVANALAFIQGFISLITLLIEALTLVSERALVLASKLFMVAAGSMVVAFGLGIYVTLAPVCLPIAIPLLVITIILGILPALVFFLELLKSILGRKIGNPIFIFSFFVMSFLFIFCLAFV